MDAVLLHIHIQRPPPLQPRMELLFRYVMLFVMYCSLSYLMYLQAAEILISYFSRYVICHMLHAIHCLISYSFMRQLNIYFISFN